MKKNFLKSTIVVVAVAASSLGAWRAYDAYEVTDNTLLAENIEALSEPPEDPETNPLTDPTISLSSILASGKCGYKADKYEVSFNINGASQSFILGLFNGKFITEAGAEVNYPNFEWKKKVDGTYRFETGDWQVCVRSVEYLFEQCNRCLQFNCIGTTDCYNNLAIPSNALDQ